MLSIIQAETEAQRQQVKALFWEYFVWANAMLNQEFGIRFDIESLLEQDMRELDKFSRPAGRLLLAHEDDQPAGLVCLRQIGADTGEVKRMYVRPAFRGKGIGRSLLARLSDEARQIGYAKLRLDSAGFMRDAHALYRTAGFKPIEPYPESEIPADFQPNWVFMELTL